MITVLIPTFNEGANIGKLIPKIRSVLEGIGRDYELIVVDGGSTDNTQEVATSLGAKVLLQAKPGYGVALKEGFQAARGDYIITMDADFSHDPDFIKEMWLKRETADLIIASRYCPGGKSDASWDRRILSRVLNQFISFALSLPIKDFSSGFRMYKKSIVQSLNCTTDDYSFLEEILIRICGNGYKIEEIPFHYLTRKIGKSHIKLFKFGVSLISTLFKMWSLRNSIFFADYDERAFNSRIPLQRFWQRQRFKIITGFIKDKLDMLDIGCGTSKIISYFPDAVGLDIELFKLRYLAQKGKGKLVQADIKQLPFKDGTFKTVICSEVIEHVKKTTENLKEISRVLGPGSELILGTPDYGKVSWLIIEWLYKKILPNAYGEGHISRYTHQELVADLESLGFSIVDYKYILGSEMIIRARKFI